MTDRQKIFVYEYLIDHNATQAAIRAGYSKKTARAIGNENLTKPDIKKVIEQMQVEQAEKCGVRFDSVINELKKIGFANIDYENVSTKDKIKALELICILLGFNKESQDEYIEDVSEAERDVYGDD